MQVNFRKGFSLTHPLELHHGKQGKHLPWCGLHRGKYKPRIKCALANLTCNEILLMSS